MLADFRLMYINISDQDAAAYLAKFYQLDVAKLGLPVLVVLDEDSAVAGQQSFPLAGDPPRLDVNAAAANFPAATHWHHKMPRIS